MGMRKDVLVIDQTRVCTSCESVANDFVEGGMECSQETIRCKSREYVAFSVVIRTRGQREIINRMLCGDTVKKQSMISGAL